MHELPYPTTVTYDLLSHKNALTYRMRWEVATREYSKQPRLYAGTLLRNIPLKARFMIAFEETPVWLEPVIFEAISTSRSDKSSLKIIFPTQFLKLSISTLIYGTEDRWIRNYLCLQQLLTQLFSCARIVQKNRVK